MSDAPTSEPHSPRERLREIEAIMDSGLQGLNLDELLSLMLERICEILSCDTVAVLLANEDGTRLVARAAKGIEEEVRQGVQVPVGSGFAGRIAAERRPIVLNRVDQTTVTNPILWEKGIKAMLGVPLVAGDHLLGVLHVGSLTEREFSSHEVGLLEMAAERVAHAVERGLHDAERAAAQMLQRSLLPSRLPTMPGLRLASRYVPSEVGGIGGDWFDAFSLPSGEFWVVIGDVAGHGLQAAVIMGRLRSAVRSYALLGWSPEEVLIGADRKLQHFERSATATVLCAAFAPPFDRCRLASAGHLPPVLALRYEPTRLLDLEPAPLLGAIDDLKPSARSMMMPTDAVLVLYTDGLVERRSTLIDRRLDLLRATVWADDPEQVCRRVMDALIGNWVPEDDIAVLAIQRT
jgi:phosphoserine phosphatase RsbU/P